MRATLAPQATDASPAKPKALAYGNRMRALAIMAVIAIHAVASDVVAFDAMPAGQWWVANAVSSAARWRVPVFVMLSGALMLDPARAETAGSFSARGSRA